MSHRPGYVIVAIAAAGGVGDLRADPALMAFPPVIAIKSVTAPPRVGTKSNSPWGVVSAGVISSHSDQWCQDGVGAPLTITFAAPVALEAIVVRPHNGYGDNVITAIEVTGDRIAHTGKLAGREVIKVAIGGAPISQIVVKIAAATRTESDITCVESIDLVSTPESVVVYGVDAKAGGALGPGVDALRGAFRSCDQKALAERLAFPFSVTYGTNYGGDKRTTSFKDAAAVAGECKAKKLVDAAKSPESWSLVQTRATGAGKVEFTVNHVFWDLEFDHERWKVRAVHFL